MKPLAGVRVLDLSRMIAGGVAGMLLADFGADVVKVEQPGRGDPLRQWTAGGDPPWWKVYSRSKRYITLNLKSADGLALLQGLVPRFAVALFGSLFSLLGPLPAEYATLGRLRERNGSKSKNAGPRGCYRTRDGRWIAVSGSTPKMAERFLCSYALGHLLDDPRFATNEAR